MGLDSPAHLAREAEEGCGEFSSKKLKHMRVWPPESHHLGGSRLLGLEIRMKN